MSSIIKKESLYMNTVERIVNLLKEKGIQQKDFVKNIGLNSSALSDWKSGQNHSYKMHIDKIADYFNVSTDYLLCRTDGPTPPGKTKAPITVEDALRVLTENMNLTEKDIEYLKKDAELLEMKNNADKLNEEVSTELIPDLS